MRSTLAEALEQHYAELAIEAFLGSNRAPNIFNRTRGAVCLERVGASPSMTRGAQVKVPGHQGNPESQPARTSQSASMVRSRGGVKSPEKAMPHQARAGEVPELEDADQSQRLDAACRQSPSRVVIRRRVRSGVAVETRTTLP